MTAATKWFLQLMALQVGTLVVLPMVAYFATGDALPIALVTGLTFLLLFLTGDSTWRSYCYWHSLEAAGLDTLAKELTERAHKLLYYEERIAVLNPSSDLQEVQPQLGAVTTMYWRAVQAERRNIYKEAAPLRAALPKKYRPLLPVPLRKEPREA